MAQSQWSFRSLSIWHLFIGLPLSYQHVCGYLTRLVLHSLMSEAKVPWRPVMSSWKLQTFESQCWPLSDWSLGSSGRVEVTVLVSFSKFRTIWLDRFQVAWRISQIRRSVMIGDRMQSWPIWFRLTRWSTWYFKPSHLALIYGRMFEMGGDT